VPKDERLKPLFFLKISYAGSEWGVSSNRLLLVVALAGFRRNTNILACWVLK